MQALAEVAAEDVMTQLREVEVHELKPKYKVEVTK